MSAATKGETANACGPDDTVTRMTLLHDVCLQTGHFELRVAELHALPLGAELAGRHEHQASSNFMGNTVPLPLPPTIIACVGLLAIARHRFVRARRRRGINVGSTWVHSANSGAASRSRSPVTDESFGARLRRERERRQIALSSIAANTKIGLGLLQALERDDLSRWPSGIFRRAFIRAYAEAAGLDPVAITQNFSSSIPMRPTTLRANRLRWHHPRGQASVVGPRGQASVGPCRAERSLTEPVASARAGLGNPSAANRPR